MPEDVIVKTWSMNETRAFREWLLKLKGKMIRITAVTSKGDVMTKIDYEVLESSDVEWKPDETQIMTIGESLRKMKEEEKHA